MMQDFSADELRLYLKEMKDRYAELFVLMNASCDQPPESRAAKGLHQTINELMAQIERKAAELKDRVEGLRQQAKANSEIETLLNEYRESLNDGLEVMGARIRNRITLLEEARRQTRERLQVIQKKKQGSRGYRRQGANSRLYKSEI